MAFRSAASTTAGSAGPTSITLPAGIQAGDSILIACSVDFTGINWSTSALGGGVALLAGPTDIASDGQTIALYGGVYTGGTISFTASGGGDWMYYAVCFSGRAASSPFTIQATTPVTTPTTSISLTGVTVATGDDIAAFFMLDTGGGAVTQSGYNFGLTEQLDTGTGFTMAAVATRDNAPSGATGNLTSTASSASAFAGWVVRVAIGAVASGGIASQSIAPNPGNLTPAGPRLQPLYAYPETVSPVVTSDMVPLDVPIRNTVERFRPAEQAISPIAAMVSPFFGWHALAAPNPVERFKAPPIDSLPPAALAVALAAFIWDPIPEHRAQTSRFVPPEPNLPPDAFAQTFAALSWDPIPPRPPIQVRRPAPEQSYVFAAFRLAALTWDPVPERKAQSVRRPPPEPGLPPYAMVSSRFVGWTSPDRRPPPRLPERQQPVLPAPPIVVTLVSLGWMPPLDPRALPRKQIRPQPSQPIGNFSAVVLPALGPYWFAEQRRPDPPLLRQTFPRFDLFTPFPFGAPVYTDASYEYYVWVPPTISDLSARSNLVVAEPDRLVVPPEERLFTA